MLVEECELLRRDLLTTDLDVTGQFASEADMKEWNWSEKLDDYHTFSLEMLSHTFLV